jgi:putative tryptophan/tyrosine transport system substrate-binding protein
MRRREFILGLGGAAACAVAAPAQEGVRRVGVLIFGTEDDPVDQTRVAALRDGLKMLDWVESHNLRLDFRFGAADPNRIRTYAKDLVGLAPDVIVTGAASAIPIVFVEGNNGTAFGLRGKLARPEGNTTGIINLYLGIGARWVELLSKPPREPAGSRPCSTRNSGQAPPGTRPKKGRDTRTPRHRVRRGL